MIKTILIEDELSVRSGLKKMLQLIEPKIKIVGETGSVIQAVSMITKQKPDLIFLDIQLEDGSGFDILKRIENPNFNIIFSTAFNQFAIDAFRFSAIDYLLKPLDPTELKNAIQKAVTNYEYKKEHHDLLHILEQNNNKQPKKLVLKTSENRYVINTQDIIHLEADGSYTIFYLKDTQIIISKNLKFYQNILDKSFIRCHQSYLVNSNHIKGITKKGEIKMTNNKSIPISVRKKSEITKLIKKL